MRKLSGLVVVSTSLALGLVSTAWSEEPIKLESHFVGDKEQPSVSYFVPWQGPGSSDSLYRNVEEKYDHSLDTVDRDVMLRSMRIYNEMNLEQGSLTQ